MSSEHYKPTRLFTIEEANAMLPLIRAIVKDLVELYHDVVERQRRLEHLNERQRETRDLYSDELDEMRHELENDRQRLREYVNELSELGVELKGPGEGLVDFPAEMDGRIVYLCWKLGEPEVDHWHELDAGFTGRQPLPAEAFNGDGSRPL